MAALIGLKFSKETTEEIYNWFLKCHEYQAWPLQRPIHPNFICIPLGWSGSNKMDNFQPLGKINQLIRFENREIRYLGERNTVVMTFKDEWVENRMCELNELGWRTKRKKICRLPMSIHSPFLAPKNWGKMLPFKEAVAVEEVIMPYDCDFGAYAHLGEKVA